ncbi:MAG: glycosyltransferase family 4 protein [Symploca sp. SIO1B1]|nr:glycosyltransferase family 4 protein [Symploca sp. SIO1B1]
MEALIMREVRLRSHQSVAYTTNLICNSTPGETAFELPEAQLKVQPVPANSDPALQAALLGVWFDELWALLHPAAFTTPGLSQTLAKVVFPDNDDTAAPPGSFERVVAHINRRRTQRSADLELHFANSFQEELDKLSKDADLISWCEIFFTQSILRQKRPDPLQRSSHQRFYSFIVIPDNLLETEPGRQILQAMSKVDAVYLQTDIYLRRVARQLEKMKLPIPELHRFDLSPDSVALRQAVRESPPSSTLIATLDPHQILLVRDALATRHQISHRFICLDRLDPIKGIHVVLEAVDKFLSSRNQTIDQLRAQYRFYFLMDYYTRFPPVDLNLAWHRYANWIRTQQIPKFKERWQGMVYFADNIPDRFIVAHLLVDAHVISGGIQEGLGLAVQEGLVVNHEVGLGRTVIMGNGAGFPIQAIEEGLGQFGFFTPAGDPDAFAQAIHDVVALDPQIHFSNTSEMVEKFITPHNHRLLP